ncbi:MAG TPA: hypothetical protein VHX44_07780, partial [Planctomycetota bacterium]|nr:hypothetical protein [Planctomycetota bacterium]
AWQGQTSQRAANSGVVSEPGPSLVMGSEHQSELATPPMECSEGDVQQQMVGFSVARVLLALSICCPIMVSVLTGYDYRVRYVPLANAIWIIAPLTGFSACLVLPRRTVPGQPRFGWGTLLGSILFLAFYCMVLLASVGVASLHR